MKLEGFWQVFRDTGDPICWLMYSAGKQQDSNREKKIKESAAYVQETEPPKME